MLFKYRKKEAIHKAYFIKGLFVSKKIILFITITLSAIYYFVFLSSENVEETTQNAISESSLALPSKESSISEITSLSESSEKKYQDIASKGNDKKNDCPTPEERKDKYFNSPYYTWSEKNLISTGFNHTTIYYQYLNEEELLLASEKGDSIAMRILGINYQWNSSYDNFQSGFVKPKELPPVKYQRKKFDKSIDEKSKFWLYKSALEGQSLALNEIAISYKYQIISRKEDGVLDPEEEQNLKNYERAYRILYEYVTPDITNFLVPKEQQKSNMSGFSQNEIEKITQIVEELKSEWRAKRSELGYPEFIKIDIPEDVRKSKEELDADPCSW